MNRFDRVEVAVLFLIRQGEARPGKAHFTWHDIAVLLSSVDVPREPDMMEALKALAAEGLISSTRTDGQERWALTPKGHSHLEAKLQRLEAPKNEEERGRGTSPSIDSTATSTSDDASTESIPLRATMKGPPTDGPSEVQGIPVPPKLRPLVGVLQQDLMGRVQGLLHFVQNPSKLIRDLRKLIELNVPVDEGITFAATHLPEPKRSKFLLELSRYPSPSLRRSLLAQWAPIRFLRPGTKTMQLPVRRWNELIRRGLTDPDVEVRTMAAGLAYDTACGAAVEVELTANVVPPGTETARIAALALGTAKSAPSLAALRRLRAHSEPYEAAFAIQAMAARKDGHPEVLAAFDDPHEDIRKAALFGLRWVMTGLTKKQRTILEARDEEEVQMALQSYDARMTVDSKA